MAPSRPTTESITARPRTWVAAATATTASDESREAVPRNFHVRWLKMMWPLRRYKGNGFFSR